MMIAIYHAQFKFISLRLDYKSKSISSEEGDSIFGIVRVFQSYEKNILPTNCKVHLVIITISIAYHVYITYYYICITYIIYVILEPKRDKIFNLRNFTQFGSLNVAL